MFTDEALHLAACFIASNLAGGTLVSYEQRQDIRTMFTLTGLRQINPTTMLLTLASDKEQVERYVRLDYSLRVGTKFAKLEDISGGVLRRPAYTPLPATLIDTLSVLVHRIDLKEGTFSVDCELSDGINTLLYPLGGLASGDMVYRDNCGQVYTLASAKEHIECGSLLAGEVILGN